MRSVSITLLVLGVVLAAATPRSSAVNVKKIKPVVASFGGECLGQRFRASTALRQLIKRSSNQHDPRGYSLCCEQGFTHDLNGDGKREVFMRLACSATGNCTWGVFSDNPSRLRGVFTAWFVYVHPRTAGWSSLSTYTREGLSQGIIANIEYRNGVYVSVAERTEQVGPFKPRGFLSQMGMPDCDEGRP
jgi:hypothetical protein